jgi:3D (Asp-Asp-Asp) domain-containing protein
MRSKELKFLSGFMVLVILYFAFVGNVIDERYEEVEIPEEYETVSIVNTSAGAANAVMSPAETAETVRVDLGKFRLTAYCSCKECCGNWSKDRPVDDFGNELVIGASGTLLEAGYSIAVDPKVIPYGTVVYIDGKEYKAQDCGKSIKGNRIDIYLSNHEDAKEFGVQYANVYFFE